ncbi:MAG: sulfotransferase domain-containing protein [bacterium]
MTTTSPPEAPPALRLPGALVVGPQKAGTTWIHEYLAWRGDVTLPHQVKETFFFDRHWSRGLPWYAGHFRGEAEPAIEVAPTYFHEPQVDERVVASLGRIPIVVTLRDPVKRTSSLWVHMRRYGMTDLPFREALDRHPELLDSSRYATHLEKWRNAVGPENVDVLFLEDLKRDPNTWAAGVCRILGLEPRDVPEELRRPVNEASVPTSHHLARLGWRVSMGLRSLGLHAPVEAAKRLGLKSVFFGRPGDRPLPSPDPADLAYVRERLLPEIERTERLLGVDLSRWK